MDALRSSRALFVQPHLDDVAFSCGGTVARAAERGEHPVVIGVFTGPPTPGEPLSAVVQQLHTKWGLGDDAWLGRRGEDERACAQLGATPMWLSHQDCPYRGYDSMLAMFSGIKPADPLIERVAADLFDAWQQTPSATVYLPLGIGGHVDHLLTHAAGALLERKGVPCAYYEDFPYASIAGQVSARLATLGEAFKAEVIDVGAWIERRIAACNAYVSQVTGMFTPTSLVAGPTEDAVKRHAGGLANALPGYIHRGPILAECFYRRAGHTHGG